MKVDNREIARAVFFKLYHAHKDRAAARLAAGIFNGSITLGLGDTDSIVESELEAFGCRFSCGRNGNTASFFMSGQTEMDADSWNRMRKEIYD